MTVTTTTNRTTYQGSGTAGPFAYPFRVLAATDLVLTTADAAGNETTLGYPGDFSVTGIGNANGGTVTLTTALASGSTLVIRRVMALTQSTDLRNQGRFAPASYEDGLDRTVMIAQQIAEVADRTVTLPVTVDPDVFSAELPVPSANRGIFFNAAETALEARVLDDSDNVALPGGARVTSDLTSYLANNAVYNVKDFGALGNGSANDTAAIQLALNQGGDVYFPAGNYLCVGLTSSAVAQTLRGDAGGKTFLTKNGNGVIFSGSGDNQHIMNLRFRGVGGTYTGHNVVLTGNNCAMINSGSRDAAGRAVKATGGQFQLFGRSDVYATSDATAAGYDLEIGVLGTNTGYHQIHGYVSTQSTGGVLFNDTGSQAVIGGQFGKMTLAAGGAAATNGGMTMGCRILGDVTVDLHNAVFVANHFGGAMDMVLGAATSTCRIDSSNTFDVGSTITNNGNANNLIMREVSTGSYNDILYGPDSSLAIMRVYAPDGSFTFPSVYVPNLGKFVRELTAHVAGADDSLDATGNWFFENRTPNKAIVYEVTGAAAFHRFYVDGVAPMDATKTGLTIYKALDHDGTTVGFYGVTPVTRAAAITAPTAPSAGYVQAEAASMKTAIDAIRAALANIGITS